MLVRIKSKLFKQLFNQPVPRVNPCCLLAVMVDEVNLAIVVLSEIPTVGQRYLTISSPWHISLFKSIQNVQQLAHTHSHHTTLTTTPPCWIPHYHEQSHSRSVTSTLNSCSPTNPSPRPRERNASTNITHRAVRVSVGVCVRRTTLPHAQQSQETDRRRS